MGHVWSRAAAMLSLSLSGGDLASEERELCAYQAERGFVNPARAVAMMLPLLDALRNGTA